MQADRFARRRNQLLRNLRKKDIPALLVTDETNVTWLTGFSGDSSWLLLSHDAAVLISDSRYQIQIAEECSGIDVVMRKTADTLLAATARVIGKAKLSTLGFESGSVSHQQWEELCGKLKAVEAAPTRGMIETLRMVKDRSELDSIREAIRCAEKGFALIRESLLPEMTELQVCHDLEHAMRRFGARGAAFDPIVAAGPRAALPHATPTGNLVSDHGMLLIDWGAESPDGYKSDLTRILVTDKISPKLEKIYGVVLKAQEQGIAAIRPGVKCSEVDNAARAVIAEAGYGKRFGHGLGHGFGLQIHEHPRLHASCDTELRPGMVVTVEPGIYLERWGGVRIEDDVLVTRDGCEVLTSTPKQLEEMVIG